MPDDEMNIVFGVLEKQRNDALAAVAMAELKLFRLQKEFDEAKKQISNTTEVLTTRIHELEGMLPQAAGEDVEICPFQKAPIGG